jgi:hypothetical protein
LRGAIRLAIVATAMTATACQSILGIEQKVSPSASESDASAFEAGSLPADGGSKLEDARGEAGAAFDARVVE